MALVKPPSHPSTEKHPPEVLEDSLLSVVPSEPALGQADTKRFGSEVGRRHSYVAVRPRWHEADQHTG